MKKQIESTITVLIIYALPIGEVAFTIPEAAGYKFQRYQVLD